MINLLPKKYKARIKHEYNSRLIVIVLTCFIFTITAAILLLAPVYFLVLNETRSLENQIETLARSETFQENTELNEFIKKTVEDLGVFAEDNEYIPPSDAIVKEILFHKRDDISITGILYNRMEQPKIDPKKDAKNNRDAKITKKEVGPIGLIAITGLAESREGLLSFAQSLDMVPAFDSVEVPIENFIVRQNIPFQITISFVKTPKQEAIIAPAIIEEINSKSS